MITSISLLNTLTGVLDFHRTIVPPSTNNNTQLTSPLLNPSDIADNTITIALQTIIISLAKHETGGEVSKLEAGDKTILYEKCEQGTFRLQEAECILYVKLENATGLIQARVIELIKLCQLLYGPPADWEASAIFKNSANTDIINAYIDDEAHDPKVITGGLEQIIMTQEVRKRIDRLLAFLESRDGVKSNGTMLVVDNVAIQTRMTQLDTRLILRYLKIRPLTEDVRHIPIYNNGKWSDLNVIRVGSYILCLQTYKNKDIAELQGDIHEFTSSLLYSKLDLPSEAMPIHLRFFTKRETLAMLYCNTKTGSVIFPQLRAAPPNIQDEILDIFWWGYNATNRTTNIKGITELQLKRGEYTFHAWLDGIHQLYILGSGPTAGNPETIIKEIIHKMNR